MKQLVNYHCLTKMLGKKMSYDDTPASRTFYSYWSNDCCGNRNCASSFLLENNYDENKLITFHKFLNYFYSLKVQQCQGCLWPEVSVNYLNFSNAKASFDQLGSFEFKKEIYSISYKLLITYRIYSHISRPSKTALKWPVFAYKPAL